ncbi:hypothetical protein [Embleya sp. NPDC001921]
MSRQESTDDSALRQQGEQVAPPAVDNKRLRQILADIYVKPGAQRWVGNGKAASALRAELDDGRPTGFRGTYHAVDVADLLGRLGKALRWESGLKDQDRSIALREAGELMDALQTPDAKGAVTAWLGANPQRMVTVANAVDTAKALPEMQSVTGSKFSQASFQRPRLESVTSDRGLMGDIKRVLSDSDSDAREPLIADVAALGLTPMSSVSRSSPSSDDGRDHKGHVLAEAVSHRTGRTTHGERTADLER